MSDNRQASNALLKGIEHIVKKELEKAPIDKTYTGIIKTVKENNLYDIIMQGQLYTNVPSIFKGLTVNSTVKVKIPQRQYSLMYIEGRFNIDVADGQGSTEQGLVDKQIIAEVKSHISNKTNPHSVTKTQIGLGNVDNTADVDKNVLSASKLTTPRTINGIEFDGTKNITITANSNDVYAWAKASSKPTYTASEVGALPSSTTLANLNDDSTHRTVTDAEKTKWNNKSDFSGNYNDLTNKPTIPSGVVVVDNLTSTSTTSSLSANQGKVLNEKIEYKTILSKSQPINQTTGDTWYQII